MINSNSRVHTTFQTYKLIYYKMMKLEIHISWMTNHENVVTLVLLQKEVVRILFIMG